ncbi:cytochrome c [Methylobacterium durans]|uniref:SorB family sulfite dehydrogenase c-type cytochrome subunit n=1 Tax=Methylobacterium durans TaxID=2202825 RepID=UPI002AFEE5A8|nr:cytochrome c [Methylobacterium durans]MEA1833738.1 cytochrome c [Methylobacterium durans]
MTRILIAACLVLAAGAALAGPKTYDLPEATAQLRPAPSGHETGFEAAQTNCLSCHSVDYIAMQPPKKGRAFWESEVTKMIKVYHAPIDEAAGKAIAAYLTEAY